MFILCILWHFGLFFDFMLFFINLIFFSNSSFFSLLVLLLQNCYFFQFISVLTLPLSILLLFLNFLMAFGLWQRTTAFTHFKRRDWFKNSICLHNMPREQIAYEGLIAFCHLSLITLDILLLLCLILYFIFIVMAKNFALWCFLNLVFFIAILLGLFMNIAGNVFFITFRLILSKSTFHIQYELRFLES